MGHAGGLHHHAPAAQREGEAVHGELGHAEPGGQGAGQGRHPPHRQQLPEPRVVHHGPGQELPRQPAHQDRRPDGQAAEHEALRVGPEH